MKIQILSPLFARGRYFCKGFVCSHQWDSCCQPGQVCWNYKMRTTNWTLNKNIKGIWSSKKTKSRICTTHTETWLYSLRIYCTSESTLLVWPYLIPGVKKRLLLPQIQQWFSKPVLCQLPDSLWRIIVLEILFNMRMVWWLCPFPLFFFFKNLTIPT